MPARATSSAAVPAATTRPCAEDDDAVAQRGDFLHHVRREQQALALRRAARASWSRSARTLMMSRPLVGSSSRIVSRIVHERARDRDLHLLALREALRCAGRRAAPGRASRTARRCARRALRRRGRAAAEVADVLARGQPRIEAARIGQHADAAANGVAVGDDVEAADARAAGVGQRRASRASAAASSCRRRWGRAGR